MNKILGIIPSRYASTRFPGKPLVDIKGKSMIQRVYEQCMKSEKLDKVIVATDDKLIYDHVLSFGGNVMMTKENHNSGTERCGEVVEKLEDANEFYNYVVNIQGDEPFISPSHIDKVCQILLDDELAEISTLVKRIETEEELFNENVVKVVMTEDFGDNEPRDILYFSRHPIPFVRQVEQKEWLSETEFYKHIGIYGFAMEEFYEIMEIENSSLEQVESLENLRWLSNHFSIQAVEVEEQTIGIDSPEDLKKLKLD